MRLRCEHIRAGRALAHMKQQDLADRSGVSLPTIRRIEGKNGPITAKHETVEALVTVLEKAGVEFTNGDQPGVRLAPGARSTS
jgi:predicted transcriptional regulator